MNRLFANLLYTLLVVFLITSCANIGTISGGDKDSIPPQMIVSKPVFLDTSFSDNQIVLYFNEYFELKDINQEFVASPPFEETPDFKIKKRSLHVKFKEPLQDSVTYNLNFGNAIADYNEGNILENYRFVFSTKSEIDSFSISGNLKNAFDLKVPEKSMVMIFEKNEDSIPYKALPNYQSKIDTSGNFSIEFIKPGTYKIFAYNDINTNKRVDDFESRAFLDSMIIPLREPFTKVDSVKAGTILHDINDPLLSDSLENDTVIIKNTFKNRPANLQLYLFDEQKLKQRIVDFSREERGKLKIVLELPAGSDFQIVPLNFRLDPANNILEKNLAKDTVTWWINDTIAMAMDSMEVNFLYTTRDSIGNPLPANDTILFEYREKKDKDAWKRKNKDENNVAEIEYLKLSYLTKDNKVDLNKKLRIESPTPFFEIDTSKIRLFEIYDTISIDTKEQKIVKAFRLQKDYLSFRFKRPIITDFKLYPINLNAENWYSASSADSNRVWNCRITDAGVASMDTIKLLVDYDNRFFFDQVQLLTDTAILPMTPQKILTRKREEP
ncbi:MAG: Ig-like domain-containing domain, partial [Bacteroidales bacterium]|nr:Ig-like domain-containing domain [Bacteroidales bacterium]